MFNVYFQVNSIEQSVYLPAIPRIGELIYIFTGLVIVTQVTYTSNSNRIHLTVDNYPVD